MNPKLDRAKQRFGAPTCDMIDKEAIEAIRFGYGLGPNARSPSTAGEMVTGAGQQDKAEERYRIASTAYRLNILDTRQETKLRKAGSTVEADRIQGQRSMAIRALGDADAMAFFQRALDSQSAFRERLVTFWADHFAVALKSATVRVLQPGLVEDAIRPNISGSFDGLLVSAALHPAMVHFLDQVNSFGPNSPEGRIRKKGLNENLARELLELHTLGVHASYSQQDVRELAELLTGVTANHQGLYYDPRRAEPGRETVLGKRYWRDATLQSVIKVLSDLAIHPETAKHLSRKLIVHFVGGVPPEDWVRKMSEAFLVSGGSLSALYLALLDDERAWSGKFINIKYPYDFIVSAARGFGLTGADIKAMEPERFKSVFINQMKYMGQPFNAPRGPSGWPDEPSAWIQPAFLAARIRWAHSFVGSFEPEIDPRDIVPQIMGNAASSMLRFAASNAENRAEGLMLVLASPEFNRR